MEDTLPAALSALFKDSLPPASAGTARTGLASEQAHDALEHYERAIDRLKAGDWSGFGTELNAMRPLLEELSR